MYDPRQVFPFSESFFLACLGGSIFLCPGTSLLSQRCPRGPTRRTNTSFTEVHASSRKRSDCGMGNT